MENRSVKRYYNSAGGASELPSITRDECVKVLDSNMVNERFELSQVRGRNTLIPTADSKLNEISVELVK